MGIEAWTTEADFTIKRAKASAALRAMKRWNESVVEEPIPELAEAKTLEEASAALFFEAETLDNGDLSGLRFSGKIDDWFDDLDTLWSRLGCTISAGSVAEALLASSLTQATFRLSVNGLCGPNFFIVSGRLTHRYGGSSDFPSISGVTANGYTTTVSRVAP